MLSEYVTWHIPRAIEFFVNNNQRLSGRRVA